MAACMLSAACSDAQLYNAIQANRLHECDKLMGDEFDACRREYSSSYEEYRREREAVDDQNLSHNPS